MVGPDYIFYFFWSRFEGKVDLCVFSLPAGSEKIKDHQVEVVMTFPDMRGCVCLCFSVWAAIGPKKKVIYEARLAFL